jgi:predicted MPP superfamily phosphohydrolase
VNSEAEAAKGEISKPRKLFRFSRRRLIAAAIFTAPLMVLGDAKWVEPGWVRTKWLRLNSGKAAHRFVQFSDVHHKGDRAYLASVVKTINALSPEFVCFTGDLIEEQKHLDEALQILSGIKAPLYGVPGNHDYWSKVKFDGIAKSFQATGGAWLLDEQRVTSDGKFSILGATCLSFKQPPLPPNPSTRNIFLMHYPAWVKKLTADKYDLMLAGHSHGGQVRIPFCGAVMVPFGVDEYELGLFHTASGPLYVNAGIGWFPVPIRFNCRPEITVIEV